MQKINILLQNHGYAGAVALNPLTTEIAVMHT